MKKESLILAMLSINTVFANTLPPTFDCDNSLPPCIESKRFEIQNSLPPTPEYVALVQKPTSIERQIIESIRMKKLKMFEQRTYC